MKRSYNQRGFTLIELMVAVALLATLSVLTFGATQSAFRSFEALTERTSRQTEIAGALNILSDDFNNMVARPVRTTPNVQSNAFRILGAQERYLVEFTRGGLPVYQMSGEQLKAMGMPSPQTGLARIAYQFIDQSLYRYEWGVLDVEPNEDITELHRTLILSDVEDIQVTAYSKDRDGSLREQSVWPPVSVRKNTALITLPQAVSVLIRLENLGTFNLFYAGV